MIFLLYLIGAGCYTMSALVSYNSRLKETLLYLPIGVGISVIANLIWFSIAKNTPDKSDTYIYSLAWDIMIVLCYAVTPVVFEGLKLSAFNILGLLLILTGFIMVKA
jgi:hypothetical protein